MEFRREQNNIFKFATKELSQDAFISWCINYINYQGAVREVGEKMLQIFLPPKVLSELDLKSASVDIKKQFYRMDMLLIINKKYFIIIEDKTDTSEHNVNNKIDDSKQKDYNEEEKQLQFYKRKLIEKLGEPDVKSQLEIEDFDEENIYTVYLKTGEMNEDDNKVNADVRLTASHLIKVIDDCLRYLDYLNGDVSFILGEYQRYLHEKIDLFNDNRSEVFMDKGMLKIGTRFGKKYQCLNCFAKYYNFSRQDAYEYNKGFQYTRKSIRNLDKISSGKICIWILRYYNSEGWINKVNNEENIIEEYRISNGRREKVDSVEDKTKYRYIFARKNDIYGSELFEFLGLYYIDIKESDDYKRIWRRYNPEKIKVSINAEEMEKELDAYLEN